MKTQAELLQELMRIEEFISSYVYEDEKVVVFVSGGLDSDVVARLCYRTLGPARVHLLTVSQPHMEPKYLENVRNLGADLQITPIVIHPRDMNVQIIERLQEADPSVPFDPNSLLDPARSNCSLRTAFLSSYQDKGFLIAANSNLSERQLGFYMPFGDNLGHFKPIAHLYKSEVQILAGMLGTHREVIDQPPSAGFWEGESDLEDLAFWLYNGGPIPAGRTFSDQECEQVMKIKAELTQFQVDTCLELLSYGHPLDEIASVTALRLSTVQAIKNTVEMSSRLKNRVLLAQLDRC